MKYVSIITKLIAALAVIAAVACSSGQKAYQSGDYYRSCTEAINRLRSKPSQGKALSALRSAYPLAVENAMRQADIATQSRDLGRLENNIAVYSRMNALAEEIQHCPAALNVIPQPRTFYTEQRETMDLVAALYYDRGIAALSQGTMQSATAAFEYLSKTCHYAPGYKDAQQRREEARYMATLRIVVSKPIVSDRYKLDGDFFYTRLMSDITARTYRNLVRFYTPSEAAAEGMNSPHEVLILDFADFTVGNTNRTTNTLELQKDSVKVGTTRVNGVEHTVYGTVKARYTQNRLEVISQGVLTIKVLNPANGRIMNQKALANKSVWASEWASFNGDERALSAAQIDASKRKPLPVPPAQELFSSFAMPLYAQASAFIGSVYSSTTPVAR